MAPPSKAILGEMKASTYPFVMTLGAATGVLFGFTELGFWPTLFLAGLTIGVRAWELLCARRSDLRA